MRYLASRRRCFLTVACVTATYLLLALVVLPQGSFFSSDEGLKFIQLQNVLRKGIADFTIDYPGRELDPDLSYVPINNPPPLVRNGKIFAVYPVFFPLLAAPLYRLLDNAGLYLIPLFSGLLVLITCTRMARVSGGNRSTSIVVLGLCTPLLFYSLLFWDHTLGTLLSSLAILVVVRNLTQPSMLHSVMSGLLIGLAIWTRSELYVMALVMPVTYFFVGGRSLRHVASLCLGTLIALAPLWLFQLLIYGNVIGPHIGHLAWLGQELPVTTNRLAIIYYTLLEGNSNLGLSFLFIMAFAASTLIVRSPRLRNSHLFVGVVFSIVVLTSLPNVIQASAGNPIGGLITTTPMFAFSFASLSDASSRQDRFLLILSLGYIALVCLTTPVDPGLQWGPRFLLPVLPPLTILALNNRRALAEAHHRLSPRRLLEVCFWSTVAVSLLLQVSSVRAMYIIRARDLKLIEDTARISCTYIVSDEYGYAQYVSPLFYEKQFLYVRDQEAYQRLAKTFVDNDIHIFAVVTYPVPHRRAVDPFDAGEGYTIRTAGNQLFEIEAEARSD